MPAKLRTRIELQGIHLLAACDDAEYITGRAVRLI
jgi:hypothetical protein